MKSLIILLEWYILKSVDKNQESPIWRKLYISEWKGNTGNFYLGWRNPATYRIVQELKKIAHSW